MSTLAPLPAVGEILDGEVVRIEPEGGYALLVPDGSRTRVMLYCTAMTKELWADFDEHRLQVGDLLYVEVLRADARTGKVSVKDRPDLERPSSASEPMDQEGNSDAA